MESERDVCSLIILEMALLGSLIRLENEEGDGDCEGVAVVDGANTLAKTVVQVVELVGVVLLLVTALAKLVAFEDVGDSFVGFSGFSNANDEKR